MALEEGKPKMSLSIKNPQLFYSEQRKQELSIIVEETQVWNLYSITTHAVRTIFCQNK